MYGDFLTWTDLAFPTFYLSGIKIGSRQLALSALSDVSRKQIQFSNSGVSILSYFSTTVDLLVYYVWED